MPRRNLPAFAAPAAVAPFVGAPFARAPFAGASFAGASFAGASFAGTTTAAATTALVAGLLLAAAGERVRGLLAVSGEVVAGALAIALPLGVWLGVLLAKTDAPGRRAAAWLLVALLFLPLYLQAAAWEAALGQLGWVTQGGWWTQFNANVWAARDAGPVDPLLVGPAGAAWIHGLAAAPWVALIVGAAVGSVDRSQEESALLDASAPRVLARVTLRHALAGGVAAAVWVGVQVASEMTVSDLVNVRTFAEEVYTQVALGAFEQGSDVPSTLGPRGLACGVLLLVLLGVAALAMAQRWIVADHASGDAPWRWRLRAGRWLAALALWIPMTLLLATPIASLATQAGVTVERIEGEATEWRRGWSAAKLASAVAAAPWQHRRDLWLTAQLGFLVATGAVAAGLVWAWRLRGARRLPLLSMAAIAALMVVPGPLLGVGVIRLLNHPWDSPLSPLTWMYDRTLLAPWLVQMARATPVATLILWPALASVPDPVLAAAEADGVGWWGRLLRVAAPMRRRVLGAAWLAALAVSVGELAATQLVLPPGPATVSQRLFTLLHYGVEDRVAGLSLAMIGFFLLLAAAAAWVTGGKPRATVDRGSPKG